MKVREIYNALDSYIPRSLSCEWDNDGLLCCPNGDREVSKILIALDVTGAVVEYAKKEGYDFILSHHPIVYKGLKSVDDEGYVSAKLISLIETFLKNKSGNLINRFGSKEHWNFYDWSDYSSGTLGKEQKAIPDLAINCLFIMALESLRELCELSGCNYPFGDLHLCIREAARAEFTFGDGLYTMHKGEEHLTVLGNSLAILSGVASEDDAIAIAEAIKCGKLSDCSLSMKVLEYEALMRLGEQNRDFILRDIEDNYRPILDYGSDTVWETKDGASAFWGAGSLCHGWSAVPVYIYNKLGIVNND